VSENYKDAVDTLKYCREHLGNITLEHKETYDLAIKALEKQILKKPIRNKRIKEIGKCPICKTELYIYDEDLHYCPTCGQALTLDSGGDGE